MTEHLQTTCLIDEPWETTPTQFYAHGTTAPIRFYGVFPGALLTSLPYKGNLLQGFPNKEASLILLTGMK